MTVKLNQTNDGDGNQLFFDPDFCNSIEYLIPYLILNTGNSTLPLTQGDNLQSKYDFYRILAKKTALQRCYWWITMRINGYIQPSDYQGDRSAIILPDIGYLNNLATSYRTIHPVT